MMEEDEEVEVDVISGMVSDEKDENSIDSSDYEEESSNDAGSSQKSVEIEGKDEQKVTGGKTIISNGIIDFPLGRVQTHLICSICKGYFRDPYTIVECLHTFCKSCLFFGFQNGFRRCPECKTMLEPDPFKAVLSDRTLQEITDKIFPELKEISDQEEIQFYKLRGIQMKNEYLDEGRRSTKAHFNDGVVTGDVEKKNKDEQSKQEQKSVENDRNNEKKAAAVLPDELSFNIYPDTTSKYPMASLTNPILRTSGRLKIATIKKYLIKKLELKVAPNIEVLCNGDPLGDELSLTFVKRTRWLHANQELTLYYRLDEEGLY